MLVLILVIAGTVLNIFILVLAENKADFSDKVSTSLILTGFPCLFLAIFGSFWMSEFRKWRPTRTVKLRIYQNGFTYESKGQIESCRWKEIKDIHCKTIEVSRGRGQPMARVKAIRSIEKRDGKVIDFAATLKLEEITKLIISARYRAQIQS